MWLPQKYTTGTQKLPAGRVPSISILHADPDQPTPRLMNPNPNPNLTPLGGLRRAGQKRGSAACFGGDRSASTNKPAAGNKYFASLVVRLGRGSLCVVVGTLLIST